MDNYDLFQQRLATSTKIPKDKLRLDKVNTFKRALNSSYNSEVVSCDDVEFQALISSITAAPAIDRKSFSTLVDNECAVGSTIYWIEDDSYWIITEHSLAEKAIFQGYIDQALYELNWKDLNTGKVYTQWACAEGPSQKSITDGTKNSILYDMFTDTLHLLIPNNIPGIDLLQRYFEVMINGKKWKINVVDNITNPSLIGLQLKEIAVDRDTDTDILVDGNIEVNFLLFSALDNIEELTIHDSVVLNPMLYKNGKLEDLDYVISVKNCTNNAGTITFNTLGNAIVDIVYKDISKSYKYTVNIVADSAADVSLVNIIGNDTVKTLNSVVYTFVNLKNGVHSSIDGSWIVDSLYFTIVNQSHDNISLKATNKTGTTEITYIFEGYGYTKEIKIIPMFGGN